ncbi:MAG: ABC transporter permease [Alphaproteobacteria bacterium]
MNKLPPWKIPLLLLPGIGIIVGFIGIVVFMVFAQSFGYFRATGENIFSTEYWQIVMNNPIFWRSTFYSLKVSTLGAIGAVMLAYPFALWLRKPFKGNLAITGILRAPMFVPGLVAAFLFVNFISYHGFLNEIFVRLGIFDEPKTMQNDPYGISVIILQIWKNMPFALLLLSGAVKGISDEVLYAAQDLGAGRIARLWKIIFPMTITILQAAFIIIFIGAVGDFAFNTVAGPRNIYSIAQLMYSVAYLEYETNQAAVIAVMLMIVSLTGALFLAFILKVIAVRRR